MTRRQIVAELDVLILRLANDIPYVPTPEDPRPIVMQEMEWAYVKGLASGAIVGFRDALARVDVELLEAGTGTTFAGTTPPVSD